MYISGTEIERFYQICVLVSNNKYAFVRDAWFYDTMRALLSLTICRFEMFSQYVFLKS